MKSIRLHMQLIIPIRVIGFYTPSSIVHRSVNIIITTHQKSNTLYELSVLSMSNRSELTNVIIQRSVKPEQSPNGIDQVAK